MLQGGVARRDFNAIRSAWTARIHHAARWHGSGVAGGGASAAAQATNRRVFGRDDRCGREIEDRCLCAAAKRAWLDRGPYRRDRAIKSGPPARAGLLGVKGLKMTIVSLM